MFNDLMWALYGIDVLERAARFLSGMFVLSLAACAVIMFICAVTSDSQADFGNKIQKTLGRVRWVLYIVWFLFFLSVFIPAKDTMYMMMGAKAADTVVNSETGKRVQEIVNSKLDEILKQLEGTK